MHGLRQESKLRSEDTEAMINKILRFFVTWQNPSQVGGNIPFSKWLILRIFNTLSNEQMDKIAQGFVEYELKDQMLLSGRRYTLLSFMDFVCSWCDASGFPYRHDRANDADMYTIRFDVGPKWAVFFEKSVRAIGDHFKEKNLEVEVINNTIIIKIKR
jgi:hypothetical protein